MSELKHVMNSAHVARAVFGHTQRTGIGNRLCVWAADGLEQLPDRARSRSRGEPPGSR